MSQRPLLIRVTPREVDEFQRAPVAHSTIEAIVEESQQQYQFSACWDHDAPLDRLLSMSPFTFGRLTNMEASGVASPLDLALMYADHMLEGDEYGLGPVMLHTPKEVQTLANHLAQVPEDKVRARFVGQVESCATSSGSSERRPVDVEYQMGQFWRLITFYQQAAQSGQAVLLVVL